MALISVEKPITKVNVNIPVSEKLSNAFKNELAIFNSSSNGVKLNFDKFAIKMINELKKINNQNGITKDGEVKYLETLDKPKQSIN
jgi:hypothetical protein